MLHRLETSRMSSFVIQLPYIIPYQYQHISKSCRNSQIWTMILTYYGTAILFHPAALTSTISAKKSLTSLNLYHPDYKVSRCYANSCL